MISAPVSPAYQAVRRNRLWWLPDGGQGNGLDDDAWAPLLEVSQQIVPDLLRVLSAAGIPGYAAPARPAAARLRSSAGHLEPYRLWVGASAYGEAESVLLAVMSQLVHKTSPHAGNA